MKGHFYFCILLLGIGNKTNARILQFTVKKYFGKNLKMEKKLFRFFCANKFYNMLKIQKKKILLVLKIELPNMQKKNMSFQFYFFSKNRKN